MGRLQDLAANPDRRPAAFRHLAHQAKREHLSRLRRLQAEIVFGDRSVTHERPPPLGSPAAAGCSRARSMLAARRRPAARR